jgi:hypothetical protein
MKQIKGDKPLLILALLPGIVAILSCSPTTPAKSPAEKLAAASKDTVLAFESAPTDTPKTDYFAANIQPILAAKCQPCHFEGGKMYAQLPFDNPQTIRELGARLFSRIKEPEEQDRLRAFLAQSPK